MVACMQAFREAMPRVHPFYAVKCNPDPVIVKELADMGAGFDCASAKEMEDIMALGVTPERIIFAHPCKRPPCLKYAVKHSVRVRTSCLPTPLPRPSTVRVGI